jgi:hypothetical protein
MTETEVAAKVVLVLGGLEVVNVEVFSTERKEDKESEGHDVQDPQHERREVMAHGGCRSGTKVVERREVVGAQPTMTEGRSTEVWANGILQVDRACCPPNRSWHASPPTAARAPP